MAQPLTWNESFAVGHEGLDAEHRDLVESINEISDAIRSQKSPEQLADLLKALRKVAVEHIRHENSILWQIRAGTYEPVQGHARTLPFQEMMAKAAFDKHMDEHDALHARFDTIIGGAVNTLSGELKAWFVHHARGYDADLKAIFQAAG
jgi:hemerythrin